MKAEYEKLCNLLKETITVMCKNGLNYKSELSVEGLLGITLDNNDVFLISIKEFITSSLAPSSSIIPRLPRSKNTSQTNNPREPPHMHHQRLEILPSDDEVDNSEVQESDRNYSEDEKCVVTGEELVSQSVSSGSSSSLYCNDRKRRPVSEFTTSRYQGTDPLTKKSRGPHSVEYSRQTPYHGNNIQSRHTRGHLQVEDAVQQVPHSSSLSLGSSGNVRSTASRLPSIGESFSADTWKTAVVSYSPASRTEHMRIKQEAVDSIENNSESDGSRLNFVQSGQTACSFQDLSVFRNENVATGHTDLYTSHLTWATAAQRQEVTAAAYTARIELVPGSGIFVSGGTMAELNSKTRGSLLVRALVKIVFPSIEVLAASCCYGRQQASHQPLDQKKVEMIKAFTLARFPDMPMNEISVVINDCCGSARRILRQRTVQQLNTEAYEGSSYASPVSLFQHSLPWQQDTESSESNPIHADQIDSESAQGTED